MSLNLTMGATLLVNCTLTDDSIAMHLYYMHAGIYFIGLPPSTSIIFILNSPPKYYYDCLKNHLFCNYYKRAQGEAGINSDDKETVTVSSYAEPHVCLCLPNILPEAPHHPRYSGVSPRIESLFLTGSGLVSAFRKKEYKKQCVL